MAEFSLWYLINETHLFNFLFFFRWFSRFGSNGCIDYFVSNCILQGKNNIFLHISQSEYFRTNPAGEDMILRWVDDEYQEKNSQDPQIVIFPCIYFIMKFVQAILFSLCNIFITCWHATTGEKKYLNFDIHLLTPRVLWCRGINSIFAMIVVNLWLLIINSW